MHGISESRGTIRRRPHSRPCASRAALCGRAPRRYWLAGVAGRSRSRRSSSPCRLSWPPPAMSLPSPTSLCAADPIMRDSVHTDTGGRGRERRSRPPPSRACAYSELSSPGSASTRRAAHALHAPPNAHQLTVHPCAASPSRTFARSQRAKRWRRSARQPPKRSAAYHLECVPRARRPRPTPSSARCATSRREMAPSPTGAHRYPIPVPSRAQLARPTPSRPTAAAKPAARKPSLDGNRYQARRVGSNKSRRRPPARRGTARPRD